MDEFVQIQNMRQEERQLYAEDMLAIQRSRNRLLDQIEQLELNEEL